MAARNLSAGRVAAQAGVSRETISRWLSGTTSPQHEAAAKVAAALNVPLQPWAPAARTPVTRLGVALVEHGWSVQQLADIAGVDRSTAQGWIAGRSRPALVNAQRLAGALDRPLTDLFNIQPAPDLARSPADRPSVPTTAEVMAHPATGRAEWRDDAACATDDNPDRWWPAPGDLGLDARTTCGGCPVLGDCRDSFLAQRDRPEDRDGIWAGLPGHQLRAAARTQARHTPGTAPITDRRRPAAARAAEVGSPGGHDRRPHAAQEPTDRPRRGEDQRQATTGRRVGPVQGLAM